MVNGCNGACDQGRRKCPHPDACAADVWEPVSDLACVRVAGVLLVCWVLMVLALTGHLSF